MGVQTLLIKKMVYLYMRYLFGAVTRLYRPNEGKNGRTSFGAKEQNGRQHNIQLCAQSTSLKSVLNTVLLRLRSTRLKKDSYGVCVFPTLDTNDTSASVGTERTKRVKRREVSC